MQGFRKKIDVVVYTMGKVGASTVSTSLRTAGFACLDIHFWAPERILASLKNSLDDPDIEIIPEHIIDSILVRNALTRQGRLKIVSLIRNPIMRNISAVFQNMPASAAGDFDRIMERLRAYSVRTPDHWFEADFIPTTGIDIFAAGFDRGADHYKFSNDAFDILLMKLEAPDARKADLLREFMNHPVEVVRANVADRKWYFDVYKRIIDNPSIVRPTFVQECLELKYYRTFYTDEDARKLAERFQAAACE
jgi:hypothetical protein